MLSPMWVTHCSIPVRHSFCLSLLVYTMRVPLVAEPQVAFSMVHHVRAEGQKFVQTTNTTGYNQEHIFAFVTGLEIRHIGQLLVNLGSRWQDVPRDHLITGVGITPRLFVATVLSQCGSIASPNIVRTTRALQNCDKQLLIARSESSKYEVVFHRLSQTLIAMNRQVTGSRPMIDFLAETADALVHELTPFEQYIKVRLMEWEENPHRKDLQDALHQLDISKEQRRDSDKMFKVREGLRQDNASINALQQRIDINYGLVSYFN